MTTGIEENRPFRPVNGTEARLSAIRETLRRGDIKKIAEMLNVSRVWASKVIHGHGTSEPLLQAAERYLQERGSN